MSNDPHSEGQAKTPVEAFQKFRWNRYVYNEGDSIEKLRVSIIDQFAKSEDELRRLLSEYNEVKSFVAAQERKETGTLLVRPISKFIRPETLVETEHLTTIIVAVPRVKEQEFLNTYEHAEAHYHARMAAEKKKQEEAEAKEAASREAQEKTLGGAALKATPKATENPEATKEVKELSKAQRMNTPTVVPGSALKVVSETDVPDDEFVLYRVVLFKRKVAGEIIDPEADRSTANVERFKSICRDNRWTVRPFRYDAHEEERNKLHMAELLNKRRARWEHIILWCESQFEEVYSAWMHVLAMRTYVEAVLRYGLSTEWISVIVNPQRNQEKKVRDALNNLYKNLANQAVFSSDGQEVDVAGFGGGDYYPYVYVPVDLTDL